MDYENPQYIGQYDPKKISELYNYQQGFEKHVSTFETTCNTKHINHINPKTSSFSSFGAQNPPPVQGAQAHSIGGPNRCRAVSRTWNPTF